MLGTLSDKMQEVFAKLRGQDKLTEENISDAVKQVRMALLEADVNYSVVKKLVERIKEGVLGQKVIKSVSPQQQFIKVVHDELASLMGGEEEGLKLKRGKPDVVMLCGLQGSGKTTCSVKLGRFLKRKNLASRPLIGACDLQRPAAIEQLRVLGEKGGIDIFHVSGATDPIEVAKQALAFAVKEGFDVLILDTAGRLHIDESLMGELCAIKGATHPCEVIFVANATTGQDAVNTAAAFHEKVALTGSILTMLDGNARGGAAISIKEVTGCPLKFEGVGEKLDDLQLFNPSSMADRILGMGDTINLVRRAEEHISEEKARDMEKKLRNQTFSFEDYLSQIRMVKQMGSLKGLMSMLPGASKLQEMNIDDKEMVKVEAMILSMTPAERCEECEFVPSRRRRIAAGSGTTIDDVNRLIKSFKQAKQFFKNMPNMKMMQKMMGGLSAWR